MIRTRRIIQPRYKYLWKYIDLYKFIDFIRSKKLYFTSLDQFDDILEGISEKVASDITITSRIANIPIMQRNSAIEPSAYETRGVHLISLIEQHKEFQKDYFVCCFYNSMYESAAMWNLYSGLDGIALRFEAKYLYNFIKEYYHANLISDYKFHAKNMDYKNLLNNSIYDDDARIKNLDTVKSPFNKDRLYQHEREYRFVFSKIKQEYEEPIVSLEGFDYTQIEILVPSSIPEWKFNLINAVLNDYHVNISIDKSSSLTRKELDKFKDIYIKYLK